jgi:hypothetical protein
MKMKIRITFKTPDVVEQTLQDAKESELSSTLMEAERAGQPISDWEAEELVDSKVAKLEHTLKKYIRYSELVTIEFDTENQIARVVPL